MRNKGRLIECTSNSKCPHSNRDIPELKEKLARYETSLLNKEKEKEEERKEKIVKAK